MFSGKGTASGNNRSHSMRATKRQFKANLIKKVVMIDGMLQTVKISSRLYKKYGHLLTK
jgi:large subunit ribosomal protein L28